MVDTGEILRDTRHKFGINAVMVATKERGGIDTGEPALVFFVKKKLPLDRLPRNKIIPEKIEGITTDVRQEQFYALSVLAESLPVVQAAW